MNHQHAILHLSLIDGIGSITLQKIIAAFEMHHWHDMYQFGVADWMRIGLKQAIAQHVSEQLQNHALLDQELSLMQKHAISLITSIDDSYPESLRSLYALPPLFYYKGKAPSVGRHIAFVGSRQANHYGKRIIEQLIPPLVAHQCTIVSGGAIGADSMAHRITIDAGGKTIVVLGSGLLNLYPYNNKKLFEDTIATGGTLLSTFPLQAEPFPGNFVARNRIIAGLADGVVVVQAAQKSGTKITAQFALDQGRDVFAVPGAFDDPLSLGCHELIQQGAKLTMNAQDILQEYGIDFLQKNESSLQSAKLPQKYPDSSIEEHIITLCCQPQSIDEIAAKTSRSLKELQLILFEMHMAGVIEQDFAGLWRVT